MIEEQTYFRAVCEGGPCCGHEMDLEWPPASGLLLQLDPAEHDGRVPVASYEFAARSTADGKKWIYVYDRFVGVMGGDFEAKKSKQEGGA